MPALQTRTSIRPFSFITREAAASTGFESFTSISITSAA
jgi:hypothetical protein